ncbi:MAG: hypothetical protein IT178_07100 [Acidobacteria bacterium]|nr:hypothetical protein [Acidobacteriota bacterium]
MAQTSYVTPAAFNAVPTVIWSGANAVTLLFTTVAPDTFRPAESPVTR